MNSKKMKVHVEIRSPQGVRKHDLAFDPPQVMLCEVLLATSQQEWGKDLFVYNESEGRMKQIPGYLMILEKRMVQQWEVDEMPVKSGNHLKFVKVVPGG